ncbi:MAG: hypothetical protein KF838_04405 [Phycisphaeraceae bacterium]|nr:MAG: hypothetical protein KF838_04405 [Phycisphaeraceae bacterium]
MTHANQISSFHQLKAAARAAHERLGLRHQPVVVRSDESAFSIADHTSAGTVLLGEGAYWVVCLADAERLVNAGYEYAPRPTSR